MGGGRTGGSRVGETRLSSSDPISSSFSSPGARRRPAAYSGREGGRGGRSPSSETGPARRTVWGRGILGAARCCPRRTAGREAPACPAEVRAETRGTSRALGLQLPPARETRAPVVGSGFVPGVPSAVSPPRRRAPVSAAQTLLAACSVARYVSSPAALSGVLYFNHTSESPLTSPFPYATRPPSASSLSRPPLLVLATPPASYLKLPLEPFRTSWSWRQWTAQWTRQGLDSYFSF